MSERTVKALAIVSSLPSITYVKKEMTEMKIGAVIQRLDEADETREQRWPGEHTRVETNAVDTS